MLMVSVESRNHQDKGMLLSQLDSGAGSSRMRAPAIRTPLAFAPL